MRKWFVAVVVGFLVLAATSAAAQELSPIIDTPEGQSGVPGGGTVVVSGRDCPAGSAVGFEYNTKPAGSTTAAQDGTWRGTAKIPIEKLDYSVEEASESSLAVTCAGQRNAVVVVYEEPPTSTTTTTTTITKTTATTTSTPVDGDTDDDNVLPVVLALLAGLAVGAGAVALVHRRRR